MKTFLGRRVIMTTLDEVPRAFRACPGYIALNPREVEAIERNAPEDKATVEELLAIVFAETAADASLRMPKVRKRTRRLGPSTRLAMLGTLNPGRAT
jgi:hypothetical protein